MTGLDRGKSWMTTWWVAVRQCAATVTREMSRKYGLGLMVGGTTGRSISSTGVGRRIGALTLVGLLVPVALGAAVIVGCVGDDPVGIDAKGRGVDGGKGPDTQSDAPDDASFSFDPISARPRVMHDESLRVRITIRRGLRQREDVTMTASGLPAGVTARPLTIKGTESTGELVVNVAATANQGPFEMSIEGTTSSYKASTKLPLFVRGKPGTVDTTFGTYYGRALSVLGAGSGQPVELLVNSKDQIYVVGACGAGACAARLTSDGAPDTTYGGGSPVVISVPNPSAAVLDSQRRLLVGGGGDMGPAVGRYLATGQIDSFYAAEESGTGGVRGNLNAPDPEFSPAQSVSALAVASDDSVFVAFSAGTYIGIRKLDSAGKNVVAFGYDRNYGGRTGANYFKWAHTSQVAGVNVQDGLLTFTGTWERTDTNQYGLGITQYHGGTGIYVPTFSTNEGYGFFIRPTQVTPRHGLLRLPDGRWLSAFGDINQNTDFLVTITADGKTLDRSFGKEGVAPLPVTGKISRFARQADGKLLVAMVLDNVDRLVRLTPSGAADASFGAAGVVDLTPFSSSTSTSVAVQSDGRILLASTSKQEKTAYVTRIWD